MNLLIDKWIPVQHAGLPEKITLQQLLCGEKTGELCLPRDDMEFACLQLLVALTQVLFTPVDKKALVQRIQKPLTLEEYVDGCEGKKDWFDLSHPETPFMQYKGVKQTKASETPLEKLLPGLNDGQSKVFINQAGLADCLCESCAAIALYHYSNNCPNMGGGPGGGIKSGLRGNSPISTLVSDPSLRRTIWLNTLTSESVDRFFQDDQGSYVDTPNYVDKVCAGDKIYPHKISLTRGLFWCPVRFEMLDMQTSKHCSHCGCKGRAYTYFRKEPFGYQMEGIWNHPYSPMFFSTKKGKKEYYVPSINSDYPSWPLLGKFIRGC